MLGIEGVFKMRPFPKGYFPTTMVKKPVSIPTSPLVNTEKDRMVPQALHIDRKTLKTLIKVGLTV